MRALYRHICESVSRKARLRSNLRLVEPPFRSRLSTLSDASREGCMSTSADHSNHCDCGSYPSRRTLLQAGLATATGIALAPTAATAQISGVGVAEGTLPGRTA